MIVSETVKAFFMFSTSSIMSSSSSTLQQMKVGRGRLEVLLGPQVLRRDWKKKVEKIHEIVISTTMNVPICM